MLTTSNMMFDPYSLRLARRAFKYVVVVSAGLLCSYWIVLGRW
jgi:hypothetical protein